VAELRARGLPLPEIGRRLGLSTQLVHSYVRLAGGPPAGWRVAAPAGRGLTLPEAGPLATAHLERSGTMRYVFFPAFAVVCFTGALHADDPAPSYQLTDSAVLTMGDKVAGHIGACLVGQSNKPRICFGLTKEIDGDPRFTFLILFRTEKMDYNPTGAGGEINSDGTVTKTKYVYSLGKFELPLTLETRRDPKTNKVIESKVVVDNLEVSGKESGVVIVDLTGDKPSYKRVKVDLPTCKVDLADKDRKTWTKAIDDAIAELKKKSKEVNTLAD
jgi:hypothetical protein